MADELERPAMALCLSDDCMKHAPNCEVTPIEGDDGDWHCPRCDEPTMNFTKTELDEFVRVYTPQGPHAP
jgi:hypothetical protein